jgi:hypothetical protein
MGPTGQTLQQSGFVIAGSLHFSLTPETITKDQRSLAKEAGVDLETLWCEMIALGGFGAEWTLFRLFQDTPALDALSEGFREAWRRFSAQGARQKRAATIFAQHRQQYGQAALAQEIQELGVIGNPIADAFAVALAKESGLSRADQIGRIGMLAEEIAVAIFDMGQKASISTLKEADQFPARSR